MGSSGLVNKQRTTFIVHLVVIIMDYDFGYLFGDQKDIVPYTCSVYYGLPADGKSFCCCSAFLSLSIWYIFCRWVGHNIHLLYSVCGYYRYCHLVPCNIHLGPGAEYRPTGTLHTKIHNGYYFYIAPSANKYVCSTAPIEYTSSTAIP